MELKEADVIFRRALFTLPSWGSERESQTLEVLFQLQETAKQSKQIQAALLQILKQKENLWEVQLEL